MHELSELSSSFLFFLSSSVSHIQQLIRAQWQETGSGDGIDSTLQFSLTCDLLILHVSTLAEIERSFLVLLDAYEKIFKKASMHTFLKTRFFVVCADQL